MARGKNKNRRKSASQEAVALQPEQSEGASGETSESTSSETAAPEIAEQAETIESAPAEPLHVVAAEPEAVPVAEAPVIEAIPEIEPAPAVELAAAAETPAIEAVPEIEPVPVVPETPPSASSLNELITPEDAPAPVQEEEQPKPKGKPRLRLLRFDRPDLPGPIEQTLQGAIEQVEKLAQSPAAAAASGELKKALSFLNEQLSGDDAKRAATSLLSRMGLAVASLDAPADQPVDGFGRDEQFEQQVLKVLEFFYRQYFRVEVRGIEHVPANGAVLLVANHSGALPWDSLMLKCALAFDHPAKRSLRPLAENFVFHFPFLGVFLNRFGAVRACQENAEALLRQGEAVAVFPEGVKGLGKTFRKRYQLQRFGRGGFVKLAQRTKTPVVPVAIVGAEETHPLLARIVRPVAPLGLPYLPVTPTFPFLGPLGLLPLPTKWTIEFGEPVHFEGGEAEDELTVAKRTEDVRGDIQGRLDKLLSQRKTWFF